jgi:hypothetical protein
MIDDDLNENSNTKQRIYNNSLGTKDLLEQMKQEYY